MSEHDANGFMTCEFCGCRTNARTRACCAEGRRADLAAAAARDAEIFGKALANVVDEQRAPAKSNPFDPDTLSSNLAVRPADVRAHVARVIRAASPASARQQASLDRAHARVGREQRSPQTSAYVLGYDPGAGEEMTAAVLMERLPDGSHRVVGVRTWSRPDARSPVDRPMLYEMIVKGWRCGACGSFVSEEKELLETCRSCDALRPAPTP